MKKVPHSFASFFSLFVLVLFTVGVDNAIAIQRNSGMIPSRRIFERSLHVRGGEYHEAVINPYVLSTSTSERGDTPFYQDTISCKNNQEIIQTPEKATAIERNSAAIPEEALLDDIIDPNIRSISIKTCVIVGTLLALNSGIINGVCLSGLLNTDNFKQGTSAVTGAWTNSALGLASGDTSQFLLNLKCILSYMAGSFISGFVNANPKPFEVNIASFRTALMTASIASMLMYGSTVLSEEQGHTRAYIFLAAMANGIQNSLTSTTTGNLVRSSHFSGITSDIGTFAGQAFRGNLENLKKLRVFMTLAASFWTGGYISYSMASHYGKTVLLFSSILYLLLALVVGNVA